MFIPSTWLTERGVAIEQAGVVDDRVVVELTATRDTAACPLCGELAHRIHSRYHRTIADLPAQGLAVRLDLLTRRFWCDAPKCPRRIFAERFPGLVAPGARRTARLDALYLALGLVLSGEAGSRLVSELGLSISADTLLRQTLASPRAEYPTPTVLGVDDWSWRKGRRWGTILVDLERRRTIDILPDRTSATLATWLAARPEIKIVSRDRAGAYADGIRQGAPQAIQIADRFHLVKNAGEVLERVLQRHHAGLRAAAKAVDQEVVASTPPVASPPSVASSIAASTAQASRPPLHARERRLARYEEVVALAETGLGPTAIGHQMGLTRQTVARWLKGGSFPERPPAAPRRMLVTAYEPYLRDRWQAGCQNSRQLWREVQAQGFTGGQETVRRLVVRWRTERGRPGPPPRTPSSMPVPSLPPAPVTRPWSPRQARWLMIKPADELKPEQQAYIEQLGQCCPEVVVAQRLTREFLRLVRERDQAALAPWLRTVEVSGLVEVVEFAKGLVRDQAAVEAALQYCWSNEHVAYCTSLL